MAERISLKSRPLDLVYFLFFLMHIPATLLIDLQAIYPTTMVPKLIAQLPVFYVQMSGDPLIGGGMGYFGTKETYVWFKTFLFLEAIFQLPVFVLGARALYKGNRSIYPLLLIYAASTTTTTLPCLSVILTTPLVQTPSSEALTYVTITPAQRLLLLSSYLPFFLLPLLMTVDMAMRVSSLVKAGLSAETQKKTT
ncbi:hypothetical protein GLOTRDRAFT_60011 [Gloeophyllum trabeum ATCC 11539]|uniref:EXPERA domain-containing protein n=1 Tax=Gloeophyllum trabeum (strain ATCC 11539 / FP-39264 / Madison 617) TaxID=670483 RepID=S7RPY0_GLOTA|nr:uncharacterized protein GLOTRDRAFT_60011 [Gloeophyllum trabeum ATCC 11539]EPQ56635.1 hypothetical protein GLOTRDRAFT_60011 [Gloeophyllum trabeum ATCC 11539]